MTVADGMQFGIQATLGAPGALIGRSLLKMISTLGLAGSALLSFTRALSAARTMAGLATAFSGEAQDNIRQRAEEWQDTQKDAVRGIVDDLIAGKSAAEAFVGALDKIANKLLDMVFDGFFTGNHNWLKGVVT